MALALGLAMSGYQALPLGYFGQPGLPQRQCSTPLEYVARAVSWLRAQRDGNITFDQNPERCWFGHRA